jgi:hypothetical protein
VSTGWPRLVDDAAMFPPGNLPLPDALVAHHAWRSSAYADLVGPLLCSDQRLPELGLLAADVTPQPGERPAEPAAVSVVVAGGAGAIEPAVTWSQRIDTVELVGIEIALRDEEDLAHNARRAATVLSQALPAEATAAVELPRINSSPTGGWLDAMDVVAESGHRAKYRTGGLDATAFPDEEELAAFIHAALDRELSFKCTAGLHRAVRNTAADTRFEQHGFLNVLLATRACLDGAAESETAQVLAERDADTVAGQVAALGDVKRTSTRAWFVSFGSCSITEPTDDLFTLGLLDEEPG